MAKARLSNNGVITEFDTLQEHEAAINTLSPTPDLTSLRKSIEHEFLGKECVKALFVALRDQEISQAEEAAIINLITPVLIALTSGFIRGARTIANNIAITAVFTNGRKNFLLAQIDDAITKL